MVKRMITADLQDRIDTAVVELRAALPHDSSGLAARLLAILEPDRLAEPDRHNRQAVIWTSSSPLTAHFDQDQ